MSDPLTFARIASEAAKRVVERGLPSDDDELDIARDAWVQLICDTNIAAARWGDAFVDDNAPVIFCGPTGRISMYPDDSLPAGTWKWRDKNPFARWFPEARP